MIWLVPLALLALLASRPRRKEPPKSLTQGELDTRARDAFRKYGR